MQFPAMIRRRTGDQAARRVGVASFPVPRADALVLRVREFAASVDRRILRIAVIAGAVAGICVLGGWIMASWGADPAQSQPAVQVPVPATAPPAPAPARPPGVRAPSTVVAAQPEHVQGLLSPLDRPPPQVIRVPSPPVTLYLPAPTRIDPTVPPVADMELLGLSGPKPH